MVKDNDWHIWSSYPRMRSVKSFLEHSAKDASFLLKNQQSQWTDAFLHRDHNEFYCANWLFHLGVVVVVVLWEIISAGRELAGRRQVILRAASTCPQVNNTTVPTILCCPPKLSSPSHAIQWNGDGAAWCAPETVSLLLTALGISWTSHWTPLLPPGIMVWKCWEKGQAKCSSDFRETEVLNGFTGKFPVASKKSSYSRSENNYELTLVFVSVVPESSLGADKSSC